MLKFFSILLLLSCALLVILALIKLFLSCWKRAEGSYVLVVTDYRGRRFYRDERVFVVPFIQRVSALTLEPVKVERTIGSLENWEGLIFEACVETKIKIGEKEGDLETAAEQLIGRTSEQIAEFVEGVLSRNFTIFLQEFSLKQLLKDAAPLCEKVETSFREDLSRMGIVVDSFDMVYFRDTQGLMEKAKPR